MARQVSVSPSIEEHPDFFKVGPHMGVSIYGPEKNRIRFGVKAVAPTTIKLRALSMVVLCCECQKPIHPFRQHKAPKKRGDMKGGIYMSVACPDDVNKGCSRGLTAKAAIQSLEDALFELLSAMEGEDE
jgi:hypothetical protein